MKFSINLLAICVLTFLVIACKKDKEEEDIPGSDPTPSEVPELGEVTSQLNEKGLYEFNADISSPNGDILEKGFVFQFGHPDASEPSLETADTLMPTSSPNNTIMLEINNSRSNLTPNGGGNCGVLWAYATNATGTAFKQSESPIPVFCFGPKILTHMVSQIGFTSGVGGGNYQANNFNPDQRGVVYSKELYPSTSDFTVIDTLWESETYELAMENLEPNTEYHVRAYYTIGPYRFYGNDVTFTTLNPISTNDVHDITTNSAKVDVDINAAFPGTVALRGTVYSPQANPTINNLFTINDEGTGAFTADITQLSSATKYYVKGYAAVEDGNDYIYYYGNEVSFTTE